jgi:hypothetical protein
MESDKELILTFLWKMIGGLDFMYILLVNIRKNKTLKAIL